MHLRSLALLLVVCAASAVEPTAELAARFHCKGAPVHPGIVRLFVNWISDPPEPQVLALDLLAAQGSNRYTTREIVSSPSGWVETKPSAADDDEGRFSYRFIGRLPSGDLVVHIRDAGSGSGVFESVLVFKLVSEPGIAVDGGATTRQVLKYVRGVVIGDRVGAAISIVDGAVEIDRAKSPDPENRGALRFVDPK